MALLVCMSDILCNWAREQRLESDLPRMVPNSDMEARTVVREPFSIRYFEFGVVYGEGYASLLSCLNRSRGILSARVISSLGGLKTSFTGSA